MMEREPPKNYERFCPMWTRGESIALVGYTIIPSWTSVSSFWLCLSPPPPLSPISPLSLFLSPFAWLGGVLIAGRFCCFSFIVSIFRDITPWSLAWVLPLGLLPARRRLGRFMRKLLNIKYRVWAKQIVRVHLKYRMTSQDASNLKNRSYFVWQHKRRRSGQSVTASDFGSNGPRFESGRGRCVESLDKALYSHCPKEKPSH